MFLLIIQTVILSSFAHAAPSVPHFDLEMTGPEYLYQIENNPVLKKRAHQKSILNAEEQELDEFLTYGKRNLEWVDFVNRSRSADKKISLSSVATQSGFPVNTPKVYNFPIIKERWGILKSLLPAPLKKVIFENAPYTTDIGVTDREFTEWLFQIDGAYQNAARYKMLNQWRSDYIQYAAYDVRGYLNLKNEENVDVMLGQWDQLESAKKKQLTKSLAMICQNAEVDRDECENELNAAVQSKTVVDFKNKYYPAAEANYNSFFNLSNARTDVSWNGSDPENFYIPFANPNKSTILDYLKFNIEDEFKWNGWQLHLNFVNSNSPTTTHVEFKPGTVPHVDSIGGSTITMDANALLSEYDVQWTIRHEYGHVLGFPDCYFEFFDQELEAFVSYQLDVTNLMCSRRGSFQQIHYDELKAAYFKN